MANDTKDRRFTDTGCDGVIDTIDTNVTATIMRNKRMLASLVQAASIQEADKLRDAWYNVMLAREYIEKPGYEQAWVMLEAEDIGDGFEDTNGGILLYNSSSGKSWNFYFGGNCKGGK